jgi:hypothetical protein
MSTISRKDAKDLCAITRDECMAVIIRLQEERDAVFVALKEIVSQIDQGGSDGKVFARDACIAQARSAIAKATEEAA